MEIRVHGKHNSIPEPLKRYAASKLEHLAKYMSTLQTIDIEIYQDGKPRSGGGHVADIAAATTGPVFRARAVSPDPKRAIDLAYQRLERQIKEFRRRRSGRPAHSRRTVESADMVKRVHPGEVQEDQPGGSKQPDGLGGRRRRKRVSKNRGGRGSGGADQGHDRG